MNRATLIEHVRTKVHTERWPNSAGRCTICGPFAEAAVDAALAALGIAHCRDDDTDQPPTDLPDSVTGYRVTGRAA